VMRQPLQQESRLVANGQNSEKAHAISLSLRAKGPSGQRNAPEKDGL
jgi:hypothetical protein